MTTSTVHFAFRVLPDALNTLLDRLRKGEPLTDLHAASHAAWLEREGILEGRLAELLDVPGLQARFAGLVAEHPDTQPMVDSAAEFLAWDDPVLFFAKDRDTIVNRAARIDRLVETGAPPIIIANDRRLLAGAIADSAQRTTPVPEPGPGRLFCEALTGPNQRLPFPAFVTFPEGGQAAFDGLQRFPIPTRTGWDFISGYTLVHQALLTGDDLRAWSEAIVNQQLDPVFAKNHGPEWLAQASPEDAATATPEQAAERLSEAWLASLQFFGFQLGRAADEGGAVLSWMFEVPLAD